MTRSIATNAIALVLSLVALIGADAIQLTTTPAPLRTTSFAMSTPIASLSNASLITLPRISPGLSIAPGNSLIPLALADIDTLSNPLSSLDQIINLPRNFCLRSVSSSQQAGLVANGAGLAGITNGRGAGARSTSKPLFGLRSARSLEAALRLHDAAIAPRKV